MPEIKYCIVCGVGSHRIDWVNKFTANGTTYVGCDSHKPEEVKAKIAEAESQKAVDVKAKVAQAPAPATVPVK